MSDMLSGDVLDVAPLVGDDFQNLMSLLPGVVRGPEFNQSGSSLGFLDRLALAPDVVLETTLSGRWFEINVNTNGRSPMVYAPQTQSGSFFNDQERTVASHQWVEALTISHRLGRGEHVFKAGTDLQRSDYNGFSDSRPVEIRRLNGSLAERTVF